MTMTTKEADQTQMPNARCCSTTTESKWPSLPTYILWMIKDNLLALFDDMRLSAVCRDWWLASKSYPRKQYRRGNGAPCLLRIRNRQSRNEQASKKARVDNRVTSNALELFCVATNKRYTLELPEFRGYNVFCSKQGWFLMVENLSNDRWKEQGVFLMNPIEGAKIELPNIVEWGYLCATRGSFSICQGYPHCVVLLVNHHRDMDMDVDCVSIRTAYKGDKVWTRHSHLLRDLRFWRLSEVITIKEHVYLRNRGGGMVVYNMETKIWKTARGSHGNLEGYDGSYITEFEGHLVEVYRRNWGEFRFFRYNDAVTSWESLTSDDIKDTSWYIKDYSWRSANLNFVTREKGLKVYYICYPIQDESQVSPGSTTSKLGEYCWRFPSDDYVHFHVVGYDLMHKRYMRSLPYCMPSDSTWVEI